MMWFDSDDYGSHGSGSTDADTHTQTGHIVGRDGRRIEWALETADGKTARFTMDGTTYDLSKGTLFLIETGGEQIGVQQLLRDLAALERTQAACQALAASDPDVAEFVRGLGE